MKKLFKGALFLAIIGTVIVGCGKEEAILPEAQTNPANNVTLKDKIKNDKNLTLDYYFVELEDNQIIYANQLNGELSVLVVDGDVPTEPAEKKFPDTWGGIKDAVKYAVGIFDEGGCIKAWRKNGFIHVVEVDC